MRNRQPCYLYSNWKALLLLLLFYGFVFIFSGPVQIPTLIIEPTVFTTIVYYMAGLQNNLYAYFLTVIITILVMAVSTSCGLYIILLLLLYNIILNINGCWSKIYSLQ